MRAAAIDLGSVRVGIAVADELGLMAHPRPALAGKDTGRLVEALAELARSESIDHFVLGLPRSLRGRDTQSTKKARAFATLLGERTGCSVELWDEWLTTQEAQRRLSEQGVRQKDQRSRIDSAAAAVLLQSWLDARRPL
jgi:putative Holliday junction resolvase